MEALSNDQMRGRDTGSEEYRKAAAYLVDQLGVAGVKPAGENGWYQSVPLRVVRFRADQSEIALVGKGGVRTLRWLHEVSLPARMNTPQSVDAGLVFDGAAGGEGIDVKGKILVRLGPVLAPNGGGRRGAGAAPAGVAGVLTIDGSGGPEPPRWPVSYSVAMTLADAAPAPAGTGSGNLTLRFNPSAAEDLFAGSGHTYKELLALAAAGKPLPRFALATTLRARMKFESGELKSDNVIGVLPGSDPELSQEYVVVSAHLDGYGVGEAGREQRSHLQRDV